jgi:hypothetical protein
VFAPCLYFVLRIGFFSNELVVGIFCFNETTTGLGRMLKPTRYQCMRSDTPNQGRRAFIYMEDIQESASST